jgi:hypothetical protein
VAQYRIGHGCHTQRACTDGGIEIKSTRMFLANQRLSDLNALLDYGGMLVLVC